MSAARPARRLLAFAIILAAQFWVFEAALRRWGSSEAAPSFQGLFEDDPAIGYRLKPHARTRFVTSEFTADIAINGAGLRDDEEIGPKPAGERRIVLLGDSLVLSVQVPFEQTFGELLERRLNARQGSTHYRVINAGVQGYGPIEEQLFFRRIVGLVQPDIVITVVFVGNDAEEAVGSKRKLTGDQRGASELAGTSFTTRLRRLVRRSMVLQILRLRVVSATERFTTTLAPPEPPLQSYAANPAPRIAEGLEISRAAVEDIMRTASDAGATTAVVLMPARFQVDDPDYGRLKEGVANAGGELLRDAASERFERALAPLGVPQCDVLPALRRALPGPDLFFQETVHLTPRGHEVVANALETFITQQVERPREDRRLPPPR
jgi:lysophospholipase L1-like esterase